MNWLDNENGSVLIDNNCVIGYVTNGSWKAGKLEDKEEDLARMNLTELLGLMAERINGKWTLTENHYKARLLGYILPFEDFKGVDAPPEERLIAISSDGKRHQFHNTIVEAKAAVEYTLRMTTYDTMKAYTDFKRGERNKEKLDQELNNLLGGHEND